MVAIPAAIASHLFEGRIQTLFHQIDEMVFSVLPQVEKFEGRVRFGRQPEDGDGEGGSTSDSIAPPPVVDRVLEKVPEKGPRKSPSREVI